MTTHTTTAADGTTISYTDTGGDGTAVVLVHGITEQLGNWAPVVDRLAEDHRVVALDLRGHGASAAADSYDLALMAGDIAAVVEAAGLDRPHLVGHSLGGMVVSGAGAVLPVSSVVNVDQPLRLAAFAELVGSIADALRDPATFEPTMLAVLGEMAGPLAVDEKARIDALRRADQTVVLGIWDVVLTSTEAELDAIVDAALAPWADNGVPYLSLFGIDPGPDYAAWLTERIPSAVVETWADHGHYPHLVDPDRFVDRLRRFWA